MERRKFQKEKKQHQISWLRGLGVIGTVAVDGECEEGLLSNNNKAGYGNSSEQHFLCYMAARRPLTHTASDSLTWTGSQSDGAFLLTSLYR